MSAGEKTIDRSAILSTGRGVLNAESTAVAGLALSLGDEFARAAEIILGLSAHGRLIVSGVGKAGFVGMKISSTFASTGVPSFFLHPAEASHGDLGRYTRFDVALIFSNSGESEEIVRLLVSIRQLGCPIICVTGNPQSALARSSTVVLSIGRVSEAGPLGLAPTTSTTLMLALGDALAMAILSQQNFTREQFALFHPGGVLGRKLMTVGALMRSGEFHAVLPEQTLTKDVMHAISRTPGRPGAATLVDSNGRLAGIFTDGDLRRCLEKGERFLDLPVSHVMGKTPKTIASDRLAEDALSLMRQHKIDQVIVVGTDLRPCGMLDIQDLLSL